MASWHRLCLWRLTHSPDARDDLNVGDIGSKTCGGFPGMAGNFELDAQTLANWQIDYLKVFQPPSKECHQAASGSSSAIRCWAMSTRREECIYSLRWIQLMQVDGCYADIHDYAKAYPLLGKYLNATGRPITYSCSWPAYLPDPVQTGFQAKSPPSCDACLSWPSALHEQ